MPEFVLLIKQGDKTEPSGTDSTQTIEKYMNWIKGLRAGGNYKGGDEVQSNGRVLVKKNGGFSAQPYTQGRDSVGGYLLIEARDYEHAVELSKGCPTFEHGGYVEIRAVSLYN